MTLEPQPIITQVDDEPPTTELYEGPLQWPSSTLHYCYICGAEVRRHAIYTLETPPVFDRWRSFPTRCDSCKSIAERAHSENTNTT